MGARGPLPKPTALRRLEGNPGKRPLNRREPRPRPVAPKCPAWLLPEARREWRRVRPELERLGLLTVVDGVALAGYCQSYARWREAEAAIDEHGATFTTDTGYVGVRPEVAIAQRSLQMLRAFCAEFGLTPASRGRMTLPEVADDGEWDGILDE